MKLQDAHAIAARICRRLRPHYRIINIAVSIRRKAKQVKDIEIVCLPVMIAGPQKTLFDENDRYHLLSSDFENIVNNLGKPIKGKPDGKYIQIELVEAINLDLFMPDDFDYYRQLALRTGSAESFQSVGKRMEEKEMVCQR